MGEGLICIVHSMSPSISGGGWMRGTVERGEDSFASSTVCLPLPWVEVGEGLIGIVHKISSSTLSGDGRVVH